MRVSKTDRRHLIGKAADREGNWCQLALISTLYMDQSVRLKLDQGRTRNVKNGRGLQTGILCVTHCTEMCRINNYIVFFVRHNSFIYKHNKNNIII